MRGLRTQENPEFELYFALVQEEAHKNGAVFFVENGEGNVTSLGAMELESLFGWLVPIEKVEEFEPLYMVWKVTPDWGRYLRFADYEVVGDKITVTFSMS